jgi:deoxyribodipyrimidine photo-lyase
MQSVNRSIVWFKNDLRLHDNETLCAAIACSKEIIPIFIIDPRWSVYTIHGFRKTGKYRLRLIYENVKALQLKLRALGSELYIIEGMPEKILPELIIRYQAKAVYTKSEFGADEIAIQAKLEKLSKMFQVTYNTLDNYSAFTKNSEKQASGIFEEYALDLKDELPVRRIFATPKQINSPKIKEQNNVAVFEQLIDTQLPFNYKGGEETASETMYQFIWGDNTINNFSSANEQDSNLNNRSMLSAWLSQGVLSAAVLVNEVKQYLIKFPESKGAKMFLTDMLWREFYLDMFKIHGKKFFRQGGIFNQKMVCLTDFENLNNWIEGKTGESLVDAGMNQIASTGLMDKKVRAISANYLNRKLMVDWRIGAAYFESQLLDYDVCINYGNWARFVGVGTEVSYNYAADYTEYTNQVDSNGVYRDLWLKNK